MSIHKNELFDLFYECDSWSRLNSGNESVDLEEIIKRLKKKYKEWKDRWNKIKEEE